MWSRIERAIRLECGYQLALQFNPFVYLDRMGFIRLIGLADIERIGYVG